MVPIMGRPLLQYWLDLLGPAQGCSEIIINTHYLPEAVRTFVAHSPFRRKITLIHEDVLLGTGGTLRMLIPYLRGSDALVAHADNLTLFDLDEFKRAFSERPNCCLATMMTFKTDTPQTCGIVELDPEGLVRRFHEKAPAPPGDLANAAVFLFGQDAWGIIEALGDVYEISLDILPRLLGRINTWHNLIYHRDIGNQRALQAAEQEFPDVYRRFKTKT
jgi:mannose-1-phosphate guanylyltransferase